MANIIPLPGYVLIEPIEDNDKTSGGLYLPESSKDKPMKGKIVAKCDFYTTVPQTVVPLDKDASTLLENVCKTKGLFGMNALLSAVYSNVAIDSVVIYKKWTNQEIEHEGKKYLLVAFSELLAVIE